MVPAAITSVAVDRCCCAVLAFADISVSVDPRISTAAVSVAAFLAIGDVGIAATYTAIYAAAVDQASADSIPGSTNVCVAASVAVVAAPFFVLCVIYSAVASAAAVGVAFVAGAFDSAFAIAFVRLLPVLLLLLLLLAAAG